MRPQREKKYRSHKKDEGKESTKAKPDNGRHDKSRRGANSR
jgi:hypothetical protein